MNESLRGLLFILVGASTQAVIKILWQRHQQRVARFRGPWDVWVGPYGGRPERHDVWTFRQHGPNVTATSKRVAPVDQAGKTWRFIGRDRESELLGFFWNTDPVVPSAGALYLKRFGDSSYRGYYLRLYESKLIRVPVRFERQAIRPWRERIRDLLRRFPH